MKPKHTYPLSEKLWFTENSEIIAEHELKKRNRYAKYTIEYGVSNDRAAKSFKTKKEALVWIKKNKKYFAPTMVYLKR